LRSIVDFGGNHGIGELDVVCKLLVNVKQGSPLWETLRDIVVLTADLKHERYV
jgi:hypothetical protein